MLEVTGEWSFTMTTLSISEKLKSTTISTFSTVTKLTQLQLETTGHFHENLENGLKFYSLNFNGILHVFDRI